MLFRSICSCSCCWLQIALIGLDYARKCDLGSGWRESPNTVSLYIPELYNLAATAASVNDCDGIGCQAAPPFPLRQGGIKPRPSLLSSYVRWEIWAITTSNTACIQHCMQQDMHADICHIKAIENMSDVLVFGFGRDLNTSEVNCWQHQLYELNPKPLRLTSWTTAKSNSSHHLVHHGKS